MLKRILILVFAMSLLLTACGGQSTIGAVNPEGCTYEYSGTFYGVNVDALELKVTSHANWVQDEDQPEYWNLVPDNDAQWVNFVSQYNNTVDKLNAGLSLLFVDDEFLQGASYYRMDLEPPVLDTSSRRECPNPDNYGYGWNHWTVGLPFEEMEDNGYVTTTRIGDTTTFVEVKSAKNSVVNYSFPTTYLETIYSYAFGRAEEVLTLEPEYVEIPRPDMPDGLTYSQAMLEQMVNADAEGREAVSFTLNIEDFEGRAQLKPVIAKGIELAASQEGYPVLATIHAMMSSGQRQIAYASMHGSFSIRGAFFLGIGGVSGGGYIDGQAGSNAWFEDVIKASVYITPQP